MLIVVGNTFNNSVLFGNAFFFSAVIRHVEMESSLPFQDSSINAVAFHAVRVQEPSGRLHNIY